VKTLIIVGVSILLWTNTSARQFIADGLYQTADFVQPK
jgi:hypothetical protein